MRQLLHATDSEVEASPDGSRVQYEELPPDFGMRVPSGDTDDEPDMDPGHASTLPTVLLLRFHFAHECCLVLIRIQAP